MNITLDLARKAVSEEAEDTINHIIFPATQGAVTQITDQKVIWVAGTQTVTLDRYTGHMSRIPSPGVATSSCQKKQKQF
jgi:hypothetical protein